MVIAYLQVAADGALDGDAPRLRRARARRHASSSIAHDTTNLTEGTGGPPDPAVLYTAEDVLDDLAGEDFEVVRAERVARTVTSPDDPESTSTAWDALVHLVRS